MTFDKLEKILAGMTPGPWKSFYHNRTESWALTCNMLGLDPVNYKDNVIASAPDGRDKWSIDFDAIATLRNLAPLMLEVFKAADKLHGGDQVEVHEFYDRISGTREIRIPAEHEIETALAALKAELADGDSPLGNQPKSGENQP